MMYTPSPPSKRPRPPKPSSAAQLRMRKTSLTAATSQPLAAVGLSPAQATADGVGSSRLEMERASAMTHVAGSGEVTGEVVSASPESEAAEVSFTLDGLPNRSSSSPRPFRPAPLALEALSRNTHIPLAQASPPPPYGQDLPQASTGTSATTSIDPGPTQRSGTPPHQDSGHPSRRTSSTPSIQSVRDHSEEGLRQRRAADAAKAMGLDIDFGSGTASASGEESEDLTGSEVKRQLKNVRRRLRQRDNELVMAAQIAQQALQTHEELVSRLSPRAKERLPSFLQLLASHQTGSSTKSRSGSAMTPRPTHHRRASNRSIMSIDSIVSPASSRDGGYLSPESMSPPKGLRTLRMVDSLGVHARPRRAAKPSKRPGARASDPPLEQELYYAQLQQADMDQRIAELEAALTEAQEGQEAQRRAAARLRKENETVYRNLARAESLLAESNTLRGMPLPVNRGARGQQGGATENVDERTWRRQRKESRYMSDHSDGGGRPPSAQEVTMSRQSSTVGEFIDSIANQHSIASLSTHTDRSRSTSPVPSNRSPSSRSTIKLSSRHISAGAPLIESRKVRKKVSPSAFLSPVRQPPLSAGKTGDRRRVVTPQVKIDPPQSEPPSPLHVRRLSHKSSLSPLNRERLSPVSRPLSPAESIASMASLVSRLSASPGYTSVSSRMASMRQYVAKHLGAGARTLGSELGSQYGAFSPDSMRLGTADAELQGTGAGVNAGGDETEWEDDDDPDHAPYGPADEEVAYLGGLLASDIEADGSPSSSPAALPPQISAALSSMASAMGPGGIEDLWSRPDRLLRRASRLALIKHDKSPAKLRKQSEWVDVTPTPTKLVVKNKSPLVTRSQAQFGQGQSRFARSPGPLMLRRLVKTDVDLFSPRSADASFSDAQSRLRPLPAGPKGLPRQLRAGDVNAGKDRGQQATSVGKAENTHDSSEEGWQDDWKEPRTVPGRLVHDLFVWLIIALEWTVYVFVLLVKMGLDLQEGKQGIMAKNRNDKRRKRYYL